MKTFLLLKLNIIVQFFGLKYISSFLIFFLILLVCSFYFIFLIINIIGLLKLNSSSSYKRQSKKSASIIIAIRNGEDSLPALIKSLINQDYKGQLEFILIDDESTDKTKQIIKKIETNDSRFKYVSSTQASKVLKFKKRALYAGIKESQYSILLFTDVDCILSPSWARSMVSYFNNGDIDYIVGFSRTKYIYGLANLFQRVDFLILMFSSAATCKIKYPLACSGQNQAYRKDLFTKVGGYDKISKLLMGDDSIFLQLCLKHKINVKFALDKGSFVYSRPEKKWIDLFIQRIRWAGDGSIMWKYNFIFFLIMCSTVGVNLLVLILGFSNWSLLLLIVVLLKFILEFFIALIGAKKFDETISFSAFIFWFIINIPYVIVMCIASFFVKFLSWQGRNQKC